MHVTWLGTLHQSYYLKLASPSMKDELCIILLNEVVVILFELYGETRC